MLPVNSVEFNIKALLKSLLGSHLHIYPLEHGWRSDTCRCSTQLIKCWKSIWTLWQSPSQFQGKGERIQLVSGRKWFPFLAICRVFQKLWKNYTCLGGLLRNIVDRQPNKTVDLEDHKEKGKNWNCYISLVHTYFKE